MAGVEYQVTKVDPTDPHTKGAVHQVYKVSEEVAATLGGKVYRARIINDPTETTVAGKVYQIVLIDDPDDPSVKGKVYNAILTGGSEVVVIGPAVSPLALDSAVADTLEYVKAYGGTMQGVPDGYTLLNGVTNGSGTYIDTGVIPTVDDVEIEIRAKPTTGSWYILQSRASGSVIWGVSGSSSGATILLGWGGTGSLCQSAITRDPTHTYYIKATMNNGTATLYVKDETDNTEDTQTNTYTSAVPSLPFWLYGNQNNDRVNSGNTVYMARIKVGGVTVMDYVPALNSSNVVGFYDKTTGNFKVSNEGTLTADQTIVPNPDTPIDIVSNNGVLKVNNNLLNSDTNVLDKFINDTGEIGDNSGSFYSALIPVKPNTEYTFYRNDGAGSYPRIHAYDSNGDWLAMIAKGEDTYALVISGTTTATTAFIRVTGKRSSDMRVYLTDYLYNAIYTDGTVETINVHGKNLFAGTPINGGYSGTGSAVTNDQKYCGNNVKLKVVAGEVYTISWYGIEDDIPYVLSAEWLEGGTWSRRRDNVISSGETSFTYTVPAGVGEINLMLYRSSGITITDNTKIQIEKGSTATTYEPYYNGGTATAEMLLKVGDYQDEQEILSGAVTREVGVKVFDGTEGFAGGQASGVQCIHITKAALGISSDTLPENSLDLICTHYKAVNGSDWDQTKPNTIKVGSGYLFFNTEYVQDITLFKAYLAAQYAAGTPVIIVYPLAEPTTESVTGQTLQVQEGNNVLEITQASLSGLKLEAKYEKEVD